MKFLKIQRGCFWSTWFFQGGDLDSLSKSNEQVLDQLTNQHQRRRSDVIGWFNRGSYLEVVRGGVNCVFSWWCDVAEDFDVTWKTSRMFGVSIFAIAFIIIAGLSLYNKLLRCQERIEQKRATIQCLWSAVKPGLEWVFQKIFRYAQTYTFKNIYTYLHAPYNDYKVTNH